MIACIRPVLLLLLLAGWISGKGQLLFAKHQPLSREHFRVTGMVQGFTFPAEQEVAWLPRAQKMASVGCVSAYAMPRGWTVGVGLSYWAIDRYWTVSGNYFVKEPAHQFQAVSVMWLFFTESRFDAAVYADFTRISAANRNYFTVLSRFRVAYWVTPHLGLAVGAMLMQGQTTDRQVIGFGVPLAGIAWQYYRLFGKRLKIRPTKACRP